MKGQFKYPCLRYLYQYRVIVSTLQTAGHLMRARGDPDFDPRHFSYVIIDECASTHETAALIPIAGKCHAQTLYIHISIHTIRDSPGDSGRFQVVIFPAT